MAARQLPTKLNPKLDVIDDNPEKWQDYVNKRRLGRTIVPVKEGSKKSESLDYAFSRVPLPKDLKGSGVFKDRPDGAKAHYYLMRRSSDGFISGTGMFRIAFPWATEEEEEAEKKHILSLDGADQTEKVGNLWIPVPEALELADEYNLRNWLLVLLDPSPIELQPNTEQDVQAPPEFHLDAKHRPKNKAEKSHMASSSSAPTPSAGRKRTTRSQSPEKSAPTPSRKSATPQPAKRGRGRPPKTDKLPTTSEANEHESDEPTRSKAGTQNSEAPPASGIRKQTSITSTPSQRRSEITENVKQTIEKITERTNDVIKASGGGKKRKVRDVEAEDEAIDAAVGNSAEAGPPAAVQPSKRIRVSELEVREQKLKNRALTGIVLSFLAGSAIPLLSSYW